MVKIDLKDMRILNQLDINSRQSLTQIGKKIGLPKNVVLYRIDRLNHEGVIKKFYTHIDAYKLGYISFRFYLTYQYTTPEIEKKILDFFQRNRFIWRIISIKGRFDLGVTIWVKSTNDFYKFWSDTMDNYGDYFTNRTFTACIQSYDYRHSYLLPEEFKKEDREKYEITGGGRHISIDDIDFKILNIIADNARMSQKEISEQINTSSSLVGYRIKNLQKQGIIQGFRINMNISLLGYHHFKLDIYLMKHKLRHKIINYIKFNPHLVHIGTSSGISDLELEFHVKSIDHLIAIMNNIFEKFPNTIKNYKYFLIDDIIKYRFMPEKD
jgi:DNA-binding Lrp family transcriptional regulator